MMRSKRNGRRNKRQRKRRKARKEGEGVDAEDIGRHLPFPSLVKKADTINPSLLF